MRRSVIITAGVIAAAIVGSVATIAVRGGSSAPAAPKPPPVSTATVVRITLADSVLMAGTLGYAATDPLINGLTGTYTQLPSVGTVVSAGQVLYRVDNLPVVLMTGGTPAWRPFAAGMTDGPDVAELQSTLIGLGDAAGLFSTASGHFDSLTVDAIERWQRAEGQPATGQIPLGQVVFLPSAVLVGAESIAIGPSLSNKFADCLIAVIARVQMNIRNDCIRTGRSNWAGRESAFRYAGRSGNPIKTIVVAENIISQGLVEVL